MGKMETNQAPEEKIATEFLPTKFMLYIRVIIGGYLIYLAYQIGSGAVIPKLVARSAGEAVDMYEVLLFSVASLAFIAIGIVLLIHFGLKLKKGYYVGGALDAGLEEDADEPQSMEESSIEENSIESQEASRSIEESSIEAQEASRSIEESSIEAQEASRSIEESSIEPQEVSHSGDENTIEAENKRVESVEIQGDKEAQE